MKLFHKLGNNFILGDDFNEKTTYWESKLTTAKDSGR